VAKINGDILVDLTRKIENWYETIEILDFSNNEAKNVYWHTSAHVLAQAVKRLFPNVKLGIGLPIEHGFYYDFDIENTSFNTEDIKHIEKEMKHIIKENLPLIRKEISKKDAIDLFNKLGEKYKVELLNEITEDKVIVYKQGEFIDLCRGPHLPSTGYIKVIKIMNISSAYWKGDENRESMQRLYGISFPTKEMLKQYLNWFKEIKRRDHRVLGTRLDLFSMPSNIIGPGLILWHPKGALIRTIIENLLRQIHLKYGYRLVVTPHIAYSKLWNLSGHLTYYREYMYILKKANIEYVVKPMNCPFHILIYKSKIRSYRDLPIRYFELGTVYRYERSGTLHGLLRVRGFTQDDAHIFCTPEQLEQEIIGILNLLEYILRLLGFKEYLMEISTWDPNEKEKYMGTEEDWAKAEKALKDALIKKSYNFKIVPGEAAFYGPKIDVKLIDSTGRKWQCATIQIDFNLPKRFNISYIGPDGKEHLVVMIHRTLLGSIERFIGILIEHYAGRFPVWLAPEQVRIIPINTRNKKILEYCKKIHEQLKYLNIRATLDIRTGTLAAKVRDAELELIPYILIIGEKEVRLNTISIRRKGQQKTLNLEDFIDVIQRDAQIPI